MILTRRFLLVAAAATAASAAIPIETKAAAGKIFRPRKLAWVVGTPGEYNFELIRAATPEEAIKLWMAEQCEGFAEPGEPCDCMACTHELVSYRMAAFDQIRNPSPGDWIRAGMGAHCDRCGYECDPEMGARAIADTAVCESCLTPEENAKDLEGAL
ncbi:hypothetical protein [Bosea sp. (in: a-proteobacteria)]|uniref:hypothetical protein n=1 Tax=Bosea sp. (in: a-proteobacteria) TaxID=1871050 RepID=UPI003B3A0133